MKKETVLLLTGGALVGLGIVFTYLKAKKENKPEDSLLPLVTTLAGLSMVAYNF